MKQKELTETFMMILNGKNLSVSIVYKKYFSVLRVGFLSFPIEKLGLILTFLKEKRES